MSTINFNDILGSIDPKVIDPFLHEKEVVVHGHCHVNGNVYVVAKTVVSFHIARFAIVHDEWQKLEEKRFGGPESALVDIALTFLRLD